MTARIHRSAGFLAFLMAGAAVAAPDPNDDAAAAAPAPPPPAAAATAPAAPAETRVPAPGADVAHPSPQTRPRLSADITSQISSALPAWRKPPPGSPPKPAPPPPGPDTVRMAPVIVNGYRIPSTANKEWMTPTGRTAQLVADYLSPLDRGLLNRFTLPLIGVSKEDRARMMYEEDKRLDDMHWMDQQISNASQVDPAAAADLRDIRDATFTRKGP